MTWIMRGIFLAFVLGVFSFSYAQERAFNFLVNPTAPGPFESVTVTAETFSFDINRANTTWRVDGEVVRNGRGIKSVEFITPAVGESVRVSFNATGGGETISQSITITPSVVDLIVEPQTYTPQLYKGRALPTHEAPIRVVALPFTNGYNPESLVYTWRINGQIQGSKSGVGRSVLETVAGPITQRKTIQVDVTSTDGVIASRGVVGIKTQQPEVLLYALNPLIGLTTSTILKNTSELQEEEITISAEPFYVPGLFRDALNLTYNWKLNGKTVQTPNLDLGTITVRQAGAGRGKAQVSVSIEHPQEVVLRGNDTATFTFGTNTEGLFNF